MAKTRWRRDYTRDIVDAKKRFDDAKEHIGDPPDGQIPLGDSGIYTSPNLQSNEPVSVFDCEQYPDSPYCGGTPWTKTPVGLEPEWGINECGVWVQLNPVLGFTKLPPVSVGYRLPGKCREEEKPPPPPPTEEDDGRQVDPLKFPDTVDPNVPVLVIIGRTYKYVYSYSGGWGYLPPIWFKTGDPSSYKYIEIHSLANVAYPIVDSLVDSYYPYPPTNTTKLVLATGIASIQYSYVESRTGEESKTYSGVAKNWIASDQSPPQPKYPNFKRYLYRDGQLKGNYLITAVVGGNDVDEAGSFILYGTLNEIKKDWDGWVSDFSTSEKTDKGIVASSYTYKCEWKVLYISIPDSSKYPPPPDQRRKKDCCMQCCNGGSQAANKQNQDNAEILRLLRKIDKNIGGFPFKAEIFDSDNNKVGIQKRTITVGSLAHANALEIGELQRTLKAIGIDHFPIYSPSSVIQDESNGLLGDLGDLKNKIFKQKIDSLAEFLAWKVRNDNEVFGTWQEVIEIQDSDPNIKGNQPKRVVLPNIAKTLKEIILLLSVLIKSQGFSLDALLKLYIDVANTKVSASVSEAILRDVQDYLDYPTETKPMDVPMGITIPKDNDPTDDKEDIEKFLQNSIIKATFDDWTGEGSLHDMMLVLLDAASRVVQKPHT